ncbi:hypothetical protein [Methanobrevibacter sp.]|uniref:hypothetical protein n=1 Tax=Methanobrevibacter sp. TaxID=66852 RepID=UPI00386E4FDA
MIYKIKAVNTKNGDVIEYDLKRVGPDDFAYFDEELGKDVHPQEVADNVIREVNNNLFLVTSPLRSIKPGETKEYNKALTFDITITCIE